MKKIAPITFGFVYADQEESQPRLRTAYGRIFALARQRIIDRQSTQKYTKGHESNYKPSHPTTRIPHDRGSSAEAKSHQSNNLQNGSQRQDPRRQVRQVMASQQRTNHGTTQGQGS